MKLASALGVLVALLFGLVAVIWLAGQGTFEDGLMHGQWTFWQKNGDVLEQKTGHYEEGFKVSK